MAILPSGSNTKILEISCSDFELTITGNPEDKKFVNLSINQNQKAELKITGEYKDEVEIKVLSIVNTDSYMVPSFFENGEYQIIFISRDKKDYKIIHMGNDISKNMQSFGDFKVGLIKFESDIGYSSFSVIKEGKEILNFIIEVFPSKVDYKSDYQEIIKDINAEISALAFEMIGKTYLTTKLKDTRTQTNVEYINILKVIFNDLEKDIKRICNSFKHNIQTIENIKSVDKSRATSRRTIDYIRKHPKTLLEASGGFVDINNKNYLPTTVVEKRKITTIDIFENRYVKYIITSIIKRLSIIEKNISKAYKEENEYLDFVKGKKIILERYIKNYFDKINDLKDKKSMSLVFQMSSGYKELYNKYIILKKGLALGEDLYKMTPKKIYNLYEIWCYIKIHHLLKEMGYYVENNGILKYKDNGIYLSLLQENEARTVYKKQDNKLELWYNKSYSSLPTVNQRPDTVLCIKNLNDKDERIYIFDAKYRVATDGNTTGPMEEDINVMHRYRDSIVSKLSNGYQFKYDTFGAYVMFPMSDEKTFTEHKFYKSIEEVNIGAFPMLPGSTVLMKDHLKKIIGESLLEAKAVRVLQDDLDDHIKFKEKNVMVVNVYNKNHLDKYLAHKFYHIPKKELSNVKLGVKYLAFYQSKKNFADEGGIKYYAKIDEVIEYKRSECSEIPYRPGKEDDIYLRFNLSKITTIKKIEPIQSARLISYTTLYLLKNASNMHMLNIKSSFEVKVYKKLYEISNKIGGKVKKEYNKYYLNNNLIELLENNKIRFNNKFIQYDKLEENILWKAENNL